MPRDGQSRVYDAKHKATRAALLPKALHTPCPRCGEPMLPGQDLDLGHTVDAVLDPTSRGDRIEHEHCNRSAGGRLGRERQLRSPSRQW